MSDLVASDGTWTGSAERVRWTWYRIVGTRRDWRFLWLRRREIRELITTPGSTVYLEVLS